MDKMLTHTIYIYIVYKVDWVFKSPTCTFDWLAVVWSVYYNQHATVNECTHPTNPFSPYYNNGIGAQSITMSVIFHYKNLLTDSDNSIQSMDYKIRNLPISSGGWFM